MDNLSVVESEVRESRIVDVDVCGAVMVAHPRPTLGRERAVAPDISTAFEHHQFDNRNGRCLHLPANGKFVSKPIKAFSSSCLLLKRQTAYMVNESC